MGSPCLASVDREGPAGNRWKYRPTPAIDDQIRAAYLRQRMGDRRALALLSARLAWPRYAIVRRGAELGVSRTKERRWSADEEQILARFGHLSITAIRRELAAAGCERSRAAIQVKMTRLRIRGNLDGYSAHRLALGLGVDAHKVAGWIRRGLLHAERRSESMDTWWITTRQVRRFVLGWPGEIDLARVEKIWFLDLITGGKLSQARAGNSTDLPQNS